MPTTTNLSITTPTVGGSSDAWGTILNAAFDTIDAVFAAAGTGVSMNIDGGQIDGITYLSIGTTAASAGQIRLPNNTFIEFRNAANSADVTAVTLTSGNVMQFGDANAASFQVGAASRNTVFPGSVELDAALDHDGSTVGFYGTTPVARQSTPSLTTSLTSNWATHYADVDTALNAIFTVFSNLGLTSG